GAVACQALSESARAAESAPRARNASSRAFTVSSHTRTASDTKPGLKLTITTPRLTATSFRIESGTLRAWLVNARADECEKITGALDVCSASDMVWSFTWDRSTSIPRRFISRTTCFPKGDSPRRDVSVDAVAQSRLRQWVSVM